MQKFYRSTAYLSANDLPNYGTVDRPNKFADRSSHWDIVLPTGASV